MADETTTVPIVETSAIRPFPQARLQLPAKYGAEKGRSGTLHTWIFSVWHYVSAAHLPKEQWVAFAGMLLEGRPMMWYELYVKPRGETLPP